MATTETTRSPCPDRILDDLGGAFGMGFVGGSAVHFLKGIYNSPKGERIIGGSQAVRMNALRIGGRFAAWGGLFSAFDCSMVYLRQKEDSWNSIFAGAATGGFLQMRQGLGPASRSALFGGVLLALIEGAEIMFDKVTSGPQNMPIFVEDFPDGLPNNVQFLNNMDLPQPASTSPWYARWFGGDEEEEKKSGGGKTEILESFDSPMPPSFELK